MPNESLIVTIADHVAVVTLNRPKKLNAIDNGLHREMMRACHELNADDDVRAVIWTGAGRGFCSGVDLSSTDRPSQESEGRQHRIDELGWVGRQAITIAKSLEKPTIAAVNGVAAGAGMSLALACDLRVGCENSRFKTVFIERSLSPDSGLSYFLPRVVGLSRAFDFLSTSRMVNSDEAYRVGLLDRLVAADDLLSAANELASEIAFWPPVAMQITKRVLLHSLESTLEEQLKYERQGLELARRAPRDVEEARASFLEKRPPHFTGG